MKVSTMRWIDAWIGVPLCLVASGILAIARWFLGPPAAADKPKSILIIKLSEIGALVTLGPAMRSLTELVGRHNVYFLTFGQSLELLEILNYVPRENIFILRTDSLKHLVWNALGALRQVRGKRIDCSVDLDFFSRATALIGLFSCRRRVGCHAFFGEGPYRGDLLTHRVKFNPHIHVSQMFEIMAKAVEQPAEDLPRFEFAPNPPEAQRDKFTPAAAELASVQHTLAEVGAGPRDTLILLNSNISDREAIPLRKWPDECYVELAQRVLAGIPDSFVLLTGAPNESESIARMETSVGRVRCRSVAGKTTLRELLTLYSKSALIVTNDSGPAHFATLTDIEVVVLFGPETPHLWRPLSNCVTVVYRGLGCSPCFSVYNGRQSRCRRNACMDIAPEEVYQVIQRQLAARSIKSSAGLRTV